MTSVRFIVRLACLIAFPAMLLGITVISASDAEAGRRVFRAGTRAAIPVVRSGSNDPATADESAASDGENSDAASSAPAASEETVDEEKATAHNSDGSGRSTSEKQVDEPQPAKAAVATPDQRVAVARPKDIEVPGCAPGHFCAVCIAGCNEGTDVIISVVARATKD